jgi:hypothetical protein
MPTYRVKPNQLLPHAGTVYEAGAVIELPRHVGADLPHLVEEVDAAGQAVPPADPWTIEAEQYQRHERRQVLARAREAEVRRLEDAQAIADREEAGATAARRAVDSLRAGLQRIDEAMATLDREALAPAPAPATPPPVTAAPEGDRPSTKTRADRTPAKERDPSAATNESST